LCVAGFCRSRALATNFRTPVEASRPFDRRRNGFVLGEGAAVLLLEEAEHAAARGARIYAELSGYGRSSDAFNITSPHPEGAGAVRCMRRALSDAGIVPESIGYVNAHGTGTPLGDRSEALALQQVFGPCVERTPVSSTKSITGHLLGASGALEAAITALAIFSGRLPPTINLDEPDPKCALNHIRGEALSYDPTHAMSNSFAFGGHDVSLVFSKANLDGEPRS